MCLRRTKLGRMHADLRSDRDRKFSIGQFALPRNGGPGLIDRRFGVQLDFVSASHTRLPGREYQPVLVDSFHSGSLILSAICTDSCKHPLSVAGFPHVRIQARRATHAIAQAPHPGCNACAMRPAARAAPESVAIKSEISTAP